MTRTLAIAEASEILLDEANELASLQGGNDHYKALPRRAQIAIRREIVRLREIVDSMEPKEEEAA